MIKGPVSSHFGEHCLGTVPRAEVRVHTPGPGGRLSEEAVHADSIRPRAHRGRPRPRAGISDTRERQRLARLGTKGFRQRCVAKPTPPVQRAALCEAQRAFQGDLCVHLRVEQEMQFPAQSSSALHISITQIPVRVPS